MPLVCLYDNASVEFYDIIDGPYKPNLRFTIGDIFKCKRCGTSSAEVFPCTHETAEALVFNERLIVNPSHIRIICVCGYEMTKWGLFPEETFEWQYMYI